MRDPKVAIVTAAGKGIGAACARGLAERGYKVVLMSPSGASVSLAQELGGVGMNGSVTETDDINRLIELALSSYGRVDGVVNNTGKDQESIESSGPGYDPDLDRRCRISSRVWIDSGWKHPNVFLGTSAYAPKYWKPEMVRFIDAHGKDKCMWGTDFPLIDHQESLAQVGELGLREASLDKFLYGNAARVFGFD